jgi:predicted nucleic acid-binding protein
MLIAYYASRKFTPLDEFSGSELISEINEVLALIRSVCPAVPLTIETHDRGRHVAERYGLSVYDAMIVAAALLGGCETLYSADMQDGLLIDDQLRICNPFTIQAN